MLPCYTTDNTFVKMQAMSLKELKFTNIYTPDKYLWRIWQLQFLKLHLQSIYFISNICWTWYAHLLLWPLIRVKFSSFQWQGRIKTIREINVFQPVVTNVALFIISNRHNVSMDASRKRMKYNVFITVQPMRVQ